MFVQHIHSGLRVQFLFSSIFTAPNKVCMARIILLLLSFILCSFAISVPGDDGRKAAGEKEKRKKSHN
jgi:hypothetical protein